MPKRLGVVVACFVLVAGGCDLNPPTPSATRPEASPTAASLDHPTGISGLASEQVLRVAVPEPESLDPNALGAPEFLRALQRPLIDFDERGEIVPALAQTWNVSADGRTLTFHLRDARYSNGDPIVAGDMVYSARRLADPRTAAQYSNVMGAVEGGRDVLALGNASSPPSDKEIDAALQQLGLVAPDDRTFVVHLAEPRNEFLSAMTLWVMAPVQEAWITGEHPTEADNFLSSGPFVLDTWDHAKEIVLKQNPNWWGEVKPTLDEIRMTISPEHESQLAYEAGDLDLVNTPTEDIRRMKGDPVLSAEYHEAPVLGINFYSFNSFQDASGAPSKDPGPTANRDFRIALTQAIDKHAVIDVTWAGVGRVANSVIMPEIPGHQPDLEPYPYDLESATQHMAKALHELGVSSASDLDPLTIAAPSGYDNEPRMAFLVEAWSQAFGLDLQPISLDQGAFWAEAANGAFDIYFGAWGADYPEPGNQLDGVFTCGGGNNNRHYCNPDFDALVAQAATERDREQQIALYQQAQQLLMEDAPILPLRYNVQSYEAKPYVVGLTDYPPGFRLPGDYAYETIRIREH